MKTGLKSLVLSTLLSVIASVGISGTVSKVGTTLYIGGTVDEAMHKQWVLNFDYTIVNVVLESPGGSVYWGQMIAEDIYNSRHRVHTEAAGRCVSMCAAIWIAADKHWYNPDQSIGFHFAYVDDADYLRDTQFMRGMGYIMALTKHNLASNLIGDFKYLGNPENFDMYMQGLIDHGLWPSSMWYPTYLELVKMEDGFKKKGN